ncbi:MAG TPA: transcriptional regulator [Geobacteraceae bacterium]|nr:transcriptional regulator [Geobacteraceae bacterium]
MKVRTKNPPIPSIKEDTVRHAIMALLVGEPVSAQDISREVRIPEREVYGHLEHIRKTLRASGRQLRVIPAECGECGFVFHKRDRLTKPGRCPVCRDGHISEPLFIIDEEDA